MVNSQNILPSAFYLGVDGGGSKTLAVVTDAQGIERGRGQADGSNYHAIGIEQTITHVDASIKQALRAAGAGVSLAAAWCGLAGADHPDDTALLRSHLCRLAPNVTVTNDVELVLGALDRRIGVALIAGTGSIAFGANDSRRSTRVGGWGHLLGDEGSGYDIGRQALRAATRAADGRGKPTLLLNQILERWQLATPSDIIPHVYQQHDKARIAGLASLTLHAARAGDPIARAIARRAAAELARAAITVCEQLGLTHDVPLALGGGLLVHEAAFRAAVLRRIRRVRSTGQVSIVSDPAATAARALAATHREGN